MKTYLVIAVAAMACLIAACGKERSCTCTITSSGVKTVRTQSPPVTFSLSLPLPMPLPNFTITPAVDQTNTNPYNIANTEIVTYDRIKYKVALQVCTSVSEEKVNTSETNVTGTSTITTTDVGTRKRQCVLD